MAEDKIVEPINNLDYLEQVLKDGYVIKGPRNDPERDLVSFKAFLKKDKEFAPEDWLESNGYEFVEPNVFTKGFRIAWKTVNDFPDERFNSKYRLVKGEKEIILYLKKEMPKLNSGVLFCKNHKLKPSSSVFLPN